MESGLARVNATLAATTATELLSKQSELNSQFADKVRARAEEFTAFTSEIQSKHHAARHRDRVEGRARPQGARYARRYPAPPGGGAPRSAIHYGDCAKCSGNKKNSKHRGAAAAAPAADPDPKTSIERQLRAQLGALTGGLAPDDYARAWWDWYLSIARQPPKQAALAHSAYEKLLDSWQFAGSLCRA